MAGHYNIPLILLAAALGAAGLACDLLIPHHGVLHGLEGLAGGVFYVAMVLLGQWVPRPRRVCLLAVAATALTVAGLVLAPTGADDPAVALASRVLTLFAIWAVALVIAGRKTAEAALNEAKARAERYLEVSQAVIVEVRRDGVVTAINRRGCELLQYDERDLVGRNWFDTCVPEKNRDAEFALFKRMMAGELPLVEYFESAVVGRGGRRAFVGWHNSASYDDDGRLAGVLTSGLDITGRKHAEVEIITAREEAEFASKAKSDFLSSMSHELRTPLNAVLGFAELMQYDPESPLTATQGERVGYILKAGNHLLYLIDQILELNKIESGHVALTMEAVEPAPLVEECLSLMRSRAEEAGVRLIDRTRPGDMPELWTDAVRLKQVLLNLLSNAVKYNRRGGEVVVAATPVAGGLLRILVNDTGLGIPAGRRDDLFKPFDRLGRETANIEGTGIGLTISKQIVERLGGRIAFASEDGEGSSFWVDIPVNRAPRAAAAHNDMSGMISDGGMATTGENGTNGTNRNDGNDGGAVRKVLYLEDDPESLQLMQAILGQIPGAELISAHTPELVLDLARQHHPALVLVDLNLPGVDGLETLRRLRQDGGFNGTPAIAVGASPHIKDIQAGLEAGFKAYLAKPLDVAKTLKIINGLL